MNKLKKFYTDLMRVDSVTISSEDPVLKGMIREAVNKMFNTNDSPTIRATSMKNGRYLDLQIRISIKEEFIESLVEHTYMIMKDQGFMHAENINLEQQLNLERLYL